MKTRKQVAEELAKYYSKQFNGIVWCFFDTQKRAYCIQGEKLPAHPDLQDVYPNGWSLLDYINPTTARKKIA